jgi:xanthine dehydrogenase YagS FAD-binding subunit
MLPNFSYVRADSPEQAVRQLSSPVARVLAGGTDLLGCLRDGVLSAETLVSIGPIESLQGIESTTDGGLRIGALTTISQIAEHPVVRQRYAGLAEAAASVASPQLRNQGTLGGNLCQRPRCWYFRNDFDCARKGGDLCYAFDGENRYHAIFGGGSCVIVHPSDTAPALVALNAMARVLGREGQRAIPLERFFVLPDADPTNENVLREGDLLTELLLPPPQGNRRSSYRKIRERGAWDFALASVALALGLDEDRIVREPRIILGGVAPVPWRSAAAERALAGARLNAETAARAATAAAGGAQPLRQNGYKVELVRAMVEESLLELF